MIDYSLVKWMSLKLLRCAECRSQVRHNVGVHYPDGKETHVAECLRCHLIRDLEPG